MRHMAAEDMSRASSSNWTASIVTPVENGILHGVTLVHGGVNLTHEPEGTDEEEGYHDLAP